MLNRTTRAPAARGPMSDATLDLDFVRMRGFVNGAGVSLENIITETRASTAMTAGPGGILRATPATTSCGSSHASRSAMRCQRARMRHSARAGVLTTLVARRRDESVCRRAIDRTEKETPGSHRDGRASGL